MSQHLADLYGERAVINLRQHAYGKAVRDLIGLTRYDSMALPKHLYILMHRACRWLGHRAQSA
jgi:hypothetical protein